MNEDQQLLAGVADRDPEAFRALLERYSRPVVNLAYRFLESRPDAEEVAQEVFLRLYQHPPKLAPAVKLFTWLYRVTANRCVDLLRRRRRRPVEVPLDLPAEPAGEEGLTLAETLASPPGASAREQVAKAELAAAARRAIAGLPEKLRIPLLLSTFQELSHSEIGQTLGLSSKAVERRLTRARELLKTRLQPYLI